MTDPTETALRATCAEAMGWTWGPPHYGHDGRWWSNPYRDKPTFTAEFSKWAGEPHDVTRRVHHLPDYPTDLNAAFQLCDEAKRRGWSVWIENSIVWHVFFFKDSGDNFETDCTEATHPNPATAIALAFVKIL